MEVIVLKPLQHNQEENISMYFPNIAVLNKAVRKIKNARWSQSNKCWYVILNKEKHNEILKAFKGLAKIEQTELRSYLIARKKKETTVATINKKITNLPPTVLKTSVAKKSLSAKEVISYKGSKIHTVNAHILPAMEQHLKLKAYSTSTIIALS